MAYLPCIMHIPFNRSTSSIPNTNIIKTALEYIFSCSWFLCFTNCNYSKHVLSIKFVFIRLSSSFLPLFTAALLQFLCNLHSFIFMQSSSFSLCPFLLDFLFFFCCFAPLFDCWWCGTNHIEMHTRIEWNWDVIQSISLKYKHFIVRLNWNDCVTVLFLLLHVPIR